MIDRKQITKVCLNCNKCGLPVITCICNEIAEVESKAKFVILSSEQEVYRNTNTASILKLINPRSTEIVIWKRKEQCEEILTYISNSRYEVYLVFPIINEEMEVRRVKEINKNKIPVFIIVDGTWKEAWKIIKKSDYLKKVQVLPLEVNKVSKFTLRRGQEEGNLCTIEAAIELLKVNKEEAISNIIDDNFMLFLECYRAGASGHKKYKKTF